MLPKTIKIIIQNNCIKIPKTPSAKEIFPTYNLNGKSLIYWNGKKEEIICKNLGKKGIGILTPDNILAIVISKLTIPFSFIVISIIIG